MWFMNMLSVDPEASALVSFYGTGLVPEGTEDQFLNQALRVDPVNKQSNR
jgi:hypothetical protein